MSRVDNNYFTYRQTPATENGTGTITDIKGNTLVWNQLVQNGNFADGTNNWEATGSSTISASNGELTVTIGGVWNNDARQNLSLVAGHKYLGTFKVKSNTLTNIGVSLAQFGAETNVRFATTDTLSSTYQTVVGIATITESTSVIRCSLTLNGSSYIGQTYTIKDVMIFDLTQMGLDISNPSDFTSLFPLSYYSYNQGTLLSFMGNGIKTVGKNLVSNSMWEQGAFDGATGQSVSAGARIRTNQFIRVMENVQYSFTMESTRQIYLYRYDMNGNYLGYYPNAWSSPLSYTPSQNELIKIALRKSDNTSINPSFINDAQFQMEIGTATSYEPYTSSTLSLPISTYFPNGMNGFSDVYDEITESKAITRITKIVLDGTENWTTETFQGVKAFYIKLLDGAYANWDANKVYCKCDRFEGTYYNYASSRAFGQITMTGRGEYIEIMADFADVASFKTWLTSNPTTVLYVSKTPTETDISPELDLTFNIDAGGTEELLPSSLLNGSVDLGSFDWSYNEQYQCFITYPVLTDSADVNTTSVPNFESIYKAVSWSVGATDVTQDMTVCYLSSAHQLRVRNKNFADPTAFKSAMSGIYLWYEKIDSTPTTSPILCDIFYRGVIPVSVVVYPIGAGTVTGAGQYRYGETATLVATPNDIYRFLRYEDENGDTLSTDSTYSFEVGE